jgi:hypothetical protein
MKLSLETIILRVHHLWVNLVRLEIMLRSIHMAYDICCSSTYSLSMKLLVGFCTKTVYLS